MSVVTPIVNELHELHITRSGGIMGSVERLTIDSNLMARVHSLTGQREFGLDSRQAEELLHALARVAQEQPGPSTRRGADMFRYDIELRWNGTVYHVSSVDLGADEALHGVMMVASQLFSGQCDSLQLRSMPHELPLRADAPIAVMRPVAAHTEFTLAIDGASRQLADARSAIDRAQRGSSTWEVSSRDAMHATRDAVAMIDDLLNRYEDLPDGMRHALVTAGNASRRALEAIGHGPEPGQPGLVPSGLAGRYQGAIEQLAAVLEQGAE